MYGGGMKKKPKRDCPACDRLGTKKDGLKWKWKWPKWQWDEHQRCWHGGPGYQIATAEETINVECEQTVTLECCHWHKKDGGHSYEGSVSIGSNPVCTTSIPFEYGFKTRLEAQQAAEEMVMKLGLCLSKLPNKGG